MRDPILNYDSRDLNDFKDWSVMDIADLKSHAEFGASLKETASFPLSGRFARGRGAKG